MIVAVLAAIFASVAAGVWAEHRYGERAQHGVQQAVKGMLWFVLPPVVVVIMARFELSAGTGAGLLLGYLVLAIVGISAWLIGSRLLHLDRASTGALIVGSILANTGYLGLPLILVVLGGDQLAYGVIWDTLISFPMAFIVAFAIGAAFGDHGAANFRERAKSFFTQNPVLWAVPVGLALPDSAVPDWLYDDIKLLATSLLPLGFFMVGVQLSAEGEQGAFRFPPPLTAPSAVIVGLRIVAAPLLLLGFAAVLIDLPDAYYLQAAMPCGINALIVGHVYKLNLPILTSAIAWSTAIFAVEVAVIAPFL
ncbi:MAG: AEC family transporter [Solirubrobacteraceae bacterium]|nr:AEC family transporter [Solirubrobacteraceae bacterium]